MFKTPQYVRDGRAPVPVKEHVSRVMSANKSKNTSPELALKRSLRVAKVGGYKRNYKKLPGKPDFVFMRQRLAVFVNGCFWHRCPKCMKRLPKTNRHYWGPKFEANVRRDARNRRALRRQGWSVMIIWECRLKSDLGSATQSLARRLDSLSLVRGN